METSNIPLTIDLAVPQGWHELGDDKLELVFTLISQEFPLSEIQTICLLRWSGITVVGRHDLGTRLCRKGKRSFLVSDEQIASLLPFLDWLGGVPPLPVRLSRIGKADALNADFQEVPFSTFIFCDNLYQGVLQSQQSGNAQLADDLLRQLSTHLYPGVKAKSLSPMHLTNTLYWFISLKAYLSQVFSDFLKPVGSAAPENLLGTPSAPSPKQLQDLMNAQIRALTKGDITKEKEILTIDTWRALAELNAQAREYQQLQNQLKKK